MVSFARKLHVRIEAAKLRYKFGQTTDTIYAVTRDGTNKMKLVEDVSKTRIINHLENPQRKFPTELHINVYDHFFLEPGRVNGHCCTPHYLQFIN